RICPGNPFNDISDDDPTETYTALLEAASPLGLAYLHAIKSPVKTLDIFAIARKHYRGALIINDSFTGASGNEAVAAKTGDTVSYGRPFIGNPDLVQRFKDELPLAKFDLKTLYTPGPV